MRRLSISLKREVALHARRVLIGGKKLVYILVAEKAHRYPHGRSRVVYIGTTRNGSTRVAQSVASRADMVLHQHGVRSFDARIVTCSSRQNVKSWMKLERALLLTFRREFGDVPLCNSKGRYAKARDEEGYFRSERLASVIREVS